MISWTRLTTVAITINVDGASQSSIRHAGEGCIARDQYGKWLMGEACNVGQIGSLTAQLLEIFFGLKLTWRMDYRNVILEAYSVEAISLIVGTGEGNYEDPLLIQSCIGNRDQERLQRGQQSG